MLCYLWNRSMIIISFIIVTKISPYLFAVENNTYIKIIALTDSSTTIRCTSTSTAGYYDDSTTNAPTRFATRFILTYLCSLLFQTSKVHLLISEKKIILFFLKLWLFLWRCNRDTMHQFYHQLVHHPCTPPYQLHQWPPKGRHHRLSRCQPPQFSNKETLRSKQLDKWHRKYMNLHQSAYKCYLQNCTLQVWSWRAISVL